MTSAIAIPLAAALLGLVVGIAILARPKGTPTHRLAGRVWVGALAVTALSSFAIWGGPLFGAIHLLSAWTLFSIVLGVRAIRRGDVPSHRRWMLGTFAGLAVAGAFTLLPGRLLGTLVFGG